MRWLIKDYPDLTEQFDQLKALPYVDKDLDIIKRFQIIKELDKLISHEQ